MVTRWHIWCEGKYGHLPSMRDDGKFVTYTDYAALEAERYRLLSENAQLRAFVRAWDEWRKNLRSKVWKDKYLSNVVDAREAVTNETL